MPDYRAYAREAAQRAGCDPDIFCRQIQQESGFDPEAYNAGSGATGICQIIARFHPEVDPRDPIASLDYAARWMASLQRQYGSYARALAAYNWGPGNVSGWDGSREALPAETRHYLDVILGPGWPEPDGRTDGGTDGTSSGSPVVGRFRVARVGADRLNVRMSPSVSAPIIDRLAEGAVIEATGPSQAADGHTWLAVRVPGGSEGWAAQTFLDALDRRYRVTDDQVRLRRQPGTHAPILAELNRGTLVDDAGAELTSAGGRTWRQVRAGGQVGWMAVDFLEPTEAAVAPTAGVADGVSAGDVAAGATYRVARVGGDRLNLRSGPSLSAPLIDRLAEGTVVVALGPSRKADGHTWLSVRAPNGAVGWAAASYLDVIEAGGRDGATAVRYRVTDEAVRLREQPSTSAPVLTELRRGNVVEAVDSEVASADGHEWRHVRDGSRTGWVAAGFLREATGTAGRYRFDPTIPTELQVQPWTCSIRSTMWLLKSIGFAITPEDAQDGMSPRYCNEELGLLDATGAGIVEYLREQHGIEAFNRGQVAFEEVAGWAGRYPVAIGGRNWGHWSAVRGIDSDGNLVLANPGGTGPRYGQQTLNRHQFEQLGSFSAVVIPCD